MTEKEIIKVLKKHCTNTNSPEFGGIDKVILSNDFIDVAKAILRLNGVSRSIGLDTKPTLMELTQKQIDNNVLACELCKYLRSDYYSEDCRKCRTLEIGIDQYYG